MAKVMYPDSDFSEEEETPLDTSFNKAATHLRKITPNLNNNQLLELYALYKQGTEGVCNTPRPGWLDGRGRKKWDAWKALGNLSKEEAKQKYIDLLTKFDPSYISNVIPTEGQVKEQWVAVSTHQYSPEPELDHNNLTLIEAAREDLGDKVTELLKERPELIDEKDEDGMTALHWAADRNATKALSAAIKAGCPVDAVDDCGQTPLHYAVTCGNVEASKLLVAAGALLLQDEEGCTPLDLAEQEDIKEILQGANTK